MTNIQVGRPKYEDTELINEFFEIVIRDTFERNDISDLVDTIAEEIQYKKRILNDDFESGGRNRYFLIAKDGDTIVGSVEYGPSNDLIVSCTNGKLKDLIEIGTVFVHPDYQKKGIGSRMLKLLFEEMKDKGIEEFCLDSGYKSAQKIWIKKFGSPEYYLKDYWGENSHHMIWRVKVEDAMKQ